VLLIYTVKSDKILGSDKGNIKYIRYTNK